MQFKSLIICRCIKCSLLNWQSKRINYVVRSTLAAETIALSDAVDDGFCISEIVSELLFNGTKSLSVEIYTNSKSLHSPIKSNQNVLEKSLRIVMLERKIITNICNIGTKTNQLMLYLKKVCQLRNYVIYCKMMLLTYEINYICPLLDGIDVMISVEQAIVSYLNLLRLISKLLNLIILLG